MTHNIQHFKFAIYLFLMIVSVILSAQRSVSGRVVSAEDRVGLPGVTVLEEGTTNGSITDVDGNFKLLVKDSTSMLIFSSIGFATVRYQVGNRTQIDVQMEVQIDELNEVVVVGYGTQSKVKVTSSISTVDTKQLKKLPVPVVSNGLEGLASGLFVRQSSGEPGFSSSSFEIRNFGSALVIIDGSPGSIDDLDPNEIKSISVLKDAAAAAVYGVQGGNGVIVIRTRKGDVGKPTLTYSNQFTFNQFTSYPEFLNAAQYATVLNEGLVNAGLDSFYTAQQIQKFGDGSDPVNYPDEDWRSLVFRNYGFQQRHNLNLNGGTDNVRYFMSAGFVDQSSNYTSDVLGYNQFNLRANIDADINESLSINLKLAGRRRINNAPAYSAYNIFRELSRALPTSLAYYPDGTPAKPAFSPNHIVEGLRDFNAGYYKARNNNVDAKLTLEWFTPVEGLSFKSYGSMVFNNYFRKEWNKSYDLYTLNRNTGDYLTYTATPEGTFSETILTLNNAFDNHYVLQNSLNYENILGNHTFSGLILGELQYRAGQDFFGRRQDFQSTYIDQLFAGSIENQGASGGQFNESRLGLIGRFSYDYKTKYLLETSFRLDGSSKFAPGREWGFFPSVSAGWRISEEPFFTAVKPVIQGLKIRASIGTAGSDGTAAYQWLSGFTYNFFYAINETAIPTIDNSVLPNKDLTWETLTTYDVGLDLVTFKEDLSFSIDFFHRDKIDVLAGASASVPSTLGVGLAAQNLHSYSNSGFEFSVNYNKSISQDLKVFAGLNYSWAREKAVFIDEAFIEDDFMRKNLTITGEYTGLRRGYISDGLFQTDEEISNHAIQDNNGNKTIRPGDVRFKDLNGDGVIDVKDQKVFGNGDKPSSNFSLNLGTDYKRFNLTVLLTGAAGYDIYLDGEAQSPLRNGFNGYTYQLDYWTPENTDSAYPRITNGGFNDNNYRYSDFWMRDGLHLRVKNINLSYALPTRGIVLSQFEEVRLFVSAYNLFVLKSFEEEFDPQMSSGTGWYYPQNKSVTFGINVSL